MLRNTLGRIPMIYRLVNRVRGYRLHGPDIRLDFSVLGSWYGGWAVPHGVLGPASVVYGFGVGEDISFDLALIERFGCEVHAFDPTPIANRWLEEQALPDKFSFHDIGLAKEDGDVKFFFPAEAHSFSMLPSSGENLESVVRPVRRLGTLMKQLGHDHIDLLKMDIEGFEYGVIDDMIGTGIRPKVINLEFHHKSYGIPARQTRDAVAKLEAAGYRIYWVSDLGREYGFILP